MKKNKKTIEVRREMKHLLDVLHMMNNIMKKRKRREKKKGLGC